MVQVSTKLVVLCLTASLAYATLPSTYGSQLGIAKYGALPSTYGSQLGIAKYGAFDGASPYGLAKYGVPYGPGQGLGLSPGGSGYGLGVARQPVSSILRAGMRGLGAGGGAAGAGAAIL
ncbi:keratin-associated protein 19-2-like isoform X2 [Coccinella septempunctata]|uniref:keratin-associated protein 19-2-like isoform X2 n=1 Tax=Coccinella septempunctata TaxID=41139 RepID=UPI001D08E07E|nr:keratin-associated protein 19-2-like isoform X2 [Coccinella septempunctata]